MCEKQTIRVLKELITQIKERGVRSIEWSSKLETIRLPSSGTFIERRSGPKQEIHISLEWANIKPADKDAGEVSEGI